MIHVDCAFRMGSTHQVCQDYAAANAEEFPCVLLADGCSGSPDTDCGARLLVRAARHFAPGLMSAWSEEQAQAGAAEAFAERLERYHREAVSRARSHAAALFLPNTCVDATLLTLGVCGERWLASVFGDGVVVAAHTSRRLEVTVIAYPGGYPFYPNYLVDMERRGALLERRSDTRQIETFLLTSEGQKENVRREISAVDAPCPFVEGRIADYHWAAVLSDGVHSFTRTCREEAGAISSRINAPISLADALCELLAFKSMRGQFVQRRMQRFQQQCGARGWQHYDDLSMGALSFEA